jgi:hypothetical protein
MSRCFALILILSLAPWTVGFAFSAPSQDQGKEPRAAQSVARPSSSVRPEDVNVFIRADERLFIMMAALSTAGYNPESGSQISSALREQLRHGLANMDPNLRARLVDYYKVHSRGDADGPFRIGGYVGLSLVMSSPPDLSIQTPRRWLPEDVVDAADFASLLQEFYSKAGVASLVRPALEQYKKEISAAQPPVAAMVLQTLSYLHTLPVLNVTERVASDNREAHHQGKKDQDRQVEIRQRTRRLIVFFNPLDASEAASIRNDILNGADAEIDRVVGDDYVVVLGSLSNLDPVRLALLRFVLEPLSERFASTLGEQAAPIGRLVERVVGAEAAQKETAFSIINDSLVRAVEVRLRRLRAEATMDNALADDEAIYDLSTYYQQGAVLAFHFYDKLIRWEEVGADIAAFYAEMIRSINFDREAARANEYRDIRTRVEARRADRRKLITGASPVVERLHQADLLIQERQFEKAQALLRDIVKQNPQNARALYGLAQVISQAASQRDPSRSSDEDAAWERLMRQLDEAVQLYQKSIAVASPETETWLISQARVAMGKILDFANQPEAAVAEYQKAIGLGDVPGGAFAQAKERLERIGK